MASATPSQFEPAFSSLRILVHVHLYYHEMWPELCSALKNLEGLKWDLFVTITNYDLATEDQVKAFKSDAKIIALPNRGFDVGPFFEVLNLVDLSKYDLVIKLHTKRDMPKHSTISGILDVSGDKWRNDLLSFIASRENLYKCLQAFKTDPNLGMAGKYRLIQRFSKCGSYRSYVLEKASDFFESVGLHPYPSHEFDFIAGTMFIVRAKILNKMKSLDLGALSFEITQRGINERDLAHLLEYYMGWLVSSQVNADGRHYVIRDPYTPWIRQKADLTYFLTRHHMTRKICRFIYRRVISKKDGMLETKIFKITVHRSKP